MLNSLFQNRFSLLIGFVILFDQITKYLVKKFIPYYDSISIVGDYIRFTFIENSGIAFGIDTSDFHIYITILTVFAIIILFFYYFDIKSKEPLLIFPLSLIIGGAIGNAIDRILEIPYEYQIDSLLHLGYSLAVLYQHMIEHDPSLDKKMRDIYAKWLKEL